MNEKIKIVLVENWLTFQLKFFVLCLLNGASFGKSQLLNTPTLANQNKSKMARKFENVRKWDVFVWLFHTALFPLHSPFFFLFFQEEIEAAKLARSKASGLWHMNEDWSIITADSFRSLSGLLSRTGELSFFGRFLPSKMTQKIHFFSWSKEWFSSKISRPNFLWRQIYKIIPTFQFVFYLFYWNKCSVILFLNFCRLILMFTSVLVVRSQIEIRKKGG